MDTPQSLATIPYELITHIASYLCPADSYASHAHKALSHLTQTCIPLRDEFQPILFQSYIHRSSSSGPRLVQFLRAIVSRPDLAAAVTRLIFHDCIDSNSLSSTDVQLIETCITDLGLPLLPIDWQIEGENRQIPLQAVLAYTPNLQHLDIPVNEEWNLDILESFPHAREKITFPRLRNLSIRYYYISGDRWGIDYGQISTLLELAPNIEHLILATSLEGFWENHDAKLPPLTSVKTIDLDENASGAFFITSLIRGCPLLQSFKLHWLSSTGYDERSEDWTVIEVLDALMHVHETLEELTFESNTDIPLGTPTTQSLSSLATFTKLKILRVDGRSIEAVFQAWKLKTDGRETYDFVAQLLPPGITTLAIWDPSYTLIPVLLALAKAKSRGLYESLGRVEVGQSPVFKSWMPRPEWRRNEKSIKREFERAGVQLEMEIPNLEIPPDLLNFLLSQGGLVG